MKNKKYSVLVKVVVETELEFSADSFEEALNKARLYKVKDVVKFDTSFVDGSIAITGVFGPDEFND